MPPRSGGATDAKRRREFRKIIEGLELEALEWREKTHVVLTLRNKYGHIGKITLPCTPSGGRSRSNLIADLRRFSKYGEPR